jgi:hypothetical protein
MSISRCRVFAIRELKPAGDRETAKGRNRESDDHAKPQRRKGQNLIHAEPGALHSWRLGVSPLPRFSNTVSRKAAKPQRTRGMSISRCRVFAIGELKPAGDREIAKVMITQRRRGARDKT